MSLTLAKRLISTGVRRSLNRKSIVIGGYGDAPAYRHTRPLRALDGLVCEGEEIRSYHQSK